MTGLNDNLTPLDIATRFARALDDADFDAARGLLDPDCTYLIRDDTHHGADAILASYEAADVDAKATFDGVGYDSAVRPDADDAASMIILFTDDLTHAGRTHRHQCEQVLHVDAAQGWIDRIEHRDLPGERDRLTAWLATVGVERS